MYLFIIYFIQADPANVGLPVENFYASMCWNDRNNCLKKCPKKLFPISGEPGRDLGRLQNVNSDVPQIQTNMHVNTSRQPVKRLVRKSKKVPKIAATLLYYHKN